MRTININGRTFAPNAKALVGSLFTPGKTHDGIWRRYQSGVLLCKPDGTPRAFAVREQGKPHGQPLLVTAGMNNGRVRFCMGLGSYDGDWLGITGVIHQYETAESIIDQANA